MTGQSAVLQVWRIAPNVSSVLGAGGAGCATAGQVASVNNVAVVLKQSFMDASLSGPPFRTGTHLLPEGAANNAPDCMVVKRQPFDTAVQ